MGSAITGGRVSSPMPCIGIESPRGSDVTGSSDKKIGSGVPLGPLTLIQYPVVWSTK
jgi:hypothetical protein